ncbi:MAG: methyl-accepting chemotaxis protein [Lachnospiraceae bacterium]|nr:methyl-accepting chemotaxis protein [Lachnospiraceae bacterium]
MKKINDIKIGARISILISAILIIGLSVLSVVSIINVRSTTSKDMQNRLTELADGHSSVVDSYFKAYVDYYIAIGDQAYIKEALKNPTPENIETAREGLKAYKASRPSMEGMFLLSKDNICLIHTDVEAVEGNPVFGDGADALEKTVSAAPDKTFIKGISVSTSTGDLVAAAYHGIYDDDGTILGYVGGGTYINELSETLNNMAIKGMDHAKIYLIDTLNSKYVISPDANEIGQEYSADDQEIVDAAKSSTNGIMDYTEEGKKMMRAYNFRDKWNLLFYICDSTSEIYKNANKLTATIIVLSVIILVLIFAATMFIAMSISKDISSVARELKQLADGRLDISIPGHLLGRKDEIGDMANSTHEVIEKLSSIVNDIKSASNSVNVSSMELAQTAEQISLTTDGVSNAVQDIAKGATEQADTIQRATENITTLSDAIQSVADNAESLASTAAVMNDNSQTSAKKLRELSKSMETMNSAMNDISNSITETNNSVSDIAGKVDGITNIASQTNLLALNASIEAARAGEAGKGFAVVAEEIGKLATESADTANEIRLVMQQLTNTSSAAMQKSEEVTGISRNVSEVLSNTVSSINDLIDEVGDTVDGVNNISGLSEECAATKTVIVDSMDSLSAISEENAAATQETSASMQELNATVNLLASSANNLGNIANSLNEDLDFFKL